ncbi:N-acetylmuramoyl-L-alanine amidase family protein [Clostridium beijerinckii]|uniref:Autolysin n=1 Tax=Clostridium beijerinckii TaxID=1520 RepID=A0A1S8SAV1_CLOBE|nr:cadherin-like beta sandwich domain-containing protein [Clostridium beijerinckii]NRY60546.1 glucan-binding YG repeat protein [Clostridium beijerinckii]OOM62583.1 autolysin [Clostridium beijerinckii]
MNKNLKRIIALVLAIGTVSAISPITKINLLTTKAYASTDDDENDDTTLESLELKTSSGSTIKLYKNESYNDKVDKDDISAGDKYYAKTSSKTINIDIDGPKSKYVKVFKGSSSSTKGKSISDDIDLSSGSTTLTVRVYKDKPDSDVKYNDDYESQYIIKVKYTGSDSNDSSDSDDSNSYDDIYLDRLSVEGDNISLSKSKTTYSYNVASNVDEVTIKAVPDDKDYTVEINGDEVNEDDDKFKKDVSLDKGTNKIEVKIENDDNEERVYTLNITRGGTSSTGTSSGTTTADSTPSTADAVSTLKPNQWIQVNGKWQYNDSTGNPVKNNWFYDRSYGKSYFLQADGSMATGWLSYGSKWYYLGSDGGMQTGWIIDGSKYYYLYADGTMASNTSIGEYKLGSDGAWIR